TVERSVSFVVDKSAPLIESFQAASSDTAISVTGAASDSPAGLASLPYRYTVGSNASAWTSSNSHTQAGLTPNTGYTVKFEAMDLVGHVSTQTQPVRTKSQAPSIMIGQATETSLELTFADSNPTGTAYQIKVGSQYAGASGTLTATPNWVIPANKKFTLAGLTANTAYAIQAQTRNEDGDESAFGAIANGVTLAASPEKIDAEASQRWIRLTWPAATGTVTYEVEADGSVISNGSSTSYLHSSLSPNTKHTYRVRVNNGGGKGSWSETISVSTLPDPPAIPVNLQATPSQTEMTVSWDLVARAETYDIEVDGNVIDNGNRISYVHQGLQPLTDHTYRVRAKNAGGIGEWSESIQQKTLPYPPKTPGNLSGEIAIHEVSLKWETSEGAASYEIEVDGLIIENQISTSYVHTDLDELSGHTYRVRAVNLGGKSAWSEPLDVTTHPEKPDTPTNLMATAEERATTMTWNQVPHAAGYEIEVDSGTIVKVDANQYVHEGLSPNSSHTYRVRALNISGTSEWSKKLSIFTLPSSTDATMALTNVAAVVTNRTITLSWDTVAPDAQYEVEVDGKITDIGTDTTFHHG
ncbi:fibronectin type III domain-containing protein, partial [Cohnella fermenti]|uniref:fibronectin type III domain-containing protein n=1 Tax=Cohnella fermenti TaxID=2565925 RepID=UPI001454C8C3